MHKTKSSIAIGLATVIFVVQGCGGSEDSIEQTSPDVVLSEQSEDSDSEELSAIEVDEGIFSTEVRIPLNLFGEDASTMMSAEELKQEMSADGYDVEVDLDGDVAVLKMSSGTYELMKAEMKSGVDELIAESLADEGDIYKSVDYSEDMREFTVEVDGSTFGQSVSFFGFSLLIVAAFYQPFAGVKVDERFVTINYIDSVSGEVLQSFDSRDL